MDKRHLAEQARQVLVSNDAGHWTRPAPGIYPHQWFWDSCLTALGWAATDPTRAATELASLARGQWDNGMIPHMIYSRRWPQRLEARLWSTGKLSPKGVRTSGITQPPVLAIAAERVAGELTPAARQKFLHAMLPVITRYHEWLYRERDPENTGLVALFHSWESGMDDSPPWSYAMRQVPHIAPRWRAFHYLNPVDRNQRATDADAQRMMGLVDIINNAQCKSHTLYAGSPVVVRDLTFNAILAVAGEALERLAAGAGHQLPAALTRQHRHTRRALENLWDDKTGQYYSFDVRMNRFIDIPTVSTFMPLYAGTASPERAEQLRQLLVSPGGFGTAHPVPSVPPGDASYRHQRYWQGPTWINMNWFIIQGLERYDFGEEAQWLRLRTLGLVQEHGFREYYDAITGDGLGAHNFSWTAALTLDLLNNTSGTTERS
jgi:glycogen debranching enzyme